MDRELQRILDCLNARQIRATYGVVAQKLNVPPISMGRLLGPRRAEASWIVNGATGLPTECSVPETHPDLLTDARIIRTLEDLESLLRACEEQSFGPEPPATSPASTATWRDEPVVPTEFDDLAVLVKMARKARGRIVDFVWHLTDEELRSLRAAVHEWGSPSVGSYKCFDARVLAAINRALGESDSLLFLNEPKNSERTDCVVDCTADGETFRLSGHATFDILFGYGMGGAVSTPGVEQRLIPSAREKLRRALAGLGWNPDSLQGERFKAVLNAMYGNRLDYGITDASSAMGPAFDISVHFHGPFSALEGNISRPCLFSADVGAKSGVYLWTILVDGIERPWYVGQTRRGFAQRTAEHIRSYLCGEYPLVDVDGLVNGECTLVAGASTAVWPHSLPQFLENYDQLAPKVRALLGALSFFVAALPDEPHLLDRVEGGIGRYFKAHEDVGLRGFFYPGIKVPAAIPFDRPLRVLVTSDTPLAGMPPELLL
jgi:hypothetical protein